jgi:NTP pyrophosphatase (non-canonical NTP hydrolase)
MTYTLKQYQEDAIRTFPDKGEQINLSHMIMGMVSELNEVEDAWDKKDLINVSEEYADIMWYLANYCTIRNIKLSAFTVFPEPDYNIDYHISKLTDHVKKYIVYNREINRQQELACVINILVTIQNYFHPEVDLGQRITFEQALENNINKLKVRYPEKFTEELAINRNLELERAELEK